jgi:hypothetical protein
MMARSKIAPPQRPDTLMQLSRSSIFEVHLVPHGRAKHLAQGTSLNRKMKMLLVLALLLTLDACQNPSRFQAAQPTLGLSRH